MAAEDLDRIERQLDDESEEDARLRQQHGSAWNRPSSAALNSALREKAAGYRCAILSPLCPSMSCVFGHLLNVLLRWAPYVCLAG